MKKNFLIFLVLLLANCVFADGKMYTKLEKVNPDIPYQRALILHKDNIETLFLQSKYSLPETIDEKPEEVGWVIPLPAIPEIATMDAEKAEYFFRYTLSRVTHPKVTKIRTLLWLGFIFLYLYLCIKTLIKEIKIARDKNSKKESIFIIKLFIIIILTFFISSFFMPALGKAGHSSVEVIKAESVGIYDVQVIRSESSDDLVNWLEENNFTFNQSDITAFENYIKNGWCFVAAKINPNLENKKEYEIVSEGLAAPLILRFESEKPIYPMALTGSGGFDTEVLIYLATDSKMTCGKQMTLRFAKEYDLAKSIPRWFYTEPNIKEFKIPVEPKDFLKEDNLNLSYLCKFKDTLTPEKMKEDIIFEPAADNEPYREHIVEW